MGKKCRTPSHLVNADEFLRTQLTSTAYTASMIRTLGEDMWRMNKERKEKQMDQTPNKTQADLRVEMSEI